MAVFRAQRHRQRAGPQLGDLTSDVGCDRMLLDIDVLGQRTVDIVERSRVGVGRPNDSAAGNAPLH